MEQYLPAFRRTLERQTLQAWLRGNLTLQVEQDARGLIHCTEMIEGLSLDQVRAFYNLPSLREKAEREALLSKPRHPFSHSAGY